MKRLIPVIIMCFLFGCASISVTPDATTKNCYGPLGDDLGNWELVANDPIMTPYGVYFDVYATNKNKSDPAQFINFLMSRDGGIVHYYTIINGEFQSYKFNSETMCFNRAEITKDVIDILKNDFREYFGLELNK